MATPTPQDLTPASRALLIKLLEEGAGNGFYEESHGCWMERGDLTGAERGNLTDLKVRGLIETVPEERGLYFVIFSDAALAMHPAGRRWLAFYREGA